MLKIIKFWTALSRINYELKDYIKNILLKYVYMYV